MRSVHTRASHLFPGSQTYRTGPSWDQVQNWTDAWFQKLRIRCHHHSWHWTAPSYSQGPICSEPAPAQRPRCAYDLECSAGCVNIRNLAPPLPSGPRSLFAPELQLPEPLQDKVPSIEDLKHVVEKLRPEMSELQAERHLDRSSWRKPPKSSAERK